MKLQQSSYSSGVLAPALRYNTDLQMWHSGLAQADNMFVKRHGGVSNRPGTRYVADTTNDEPGRIIKFARAVDDVFGLVFGSGTIRQLKDGAVSDFPAPPNGFETESISLANGDWFEWDRTLGAANWSIDFKVQTLPTADALFAGFGPGVTTTGGLTLSFLYSASSVVGGPVDTWAIVVRDLGVIVALDTTYNVSVTLDTTALKYYVYVDGALKYTQSLVAGLTGQYDLVYDPTERDPLDVYRADPRIMVDDVTLEVDVLRVQDRYNSLDYLDWEPSVNDPTATPPVQGYFYDNVSDTDVFNTGTAATYATPNGELVLYPDVASPYAVWDLPEVRYVQQENAIYFTHPGYPEYVLQRISVGFWQMGPVDYAPEIETPEGLVSTPTGLTGTAVQYEYVVAGLTYEGLESSPSEVVTANGNTPDQWPSGALVTLTWGESEGADKYAVYKNTRGYFGRIGTAEAGYFIDDNIEPDLADGPRELQEPFTEVDDRPTAIGVYQQRKVYGGSTNMRNRTWFTRTGTMSELSVSYPLKSTDAITADLVAEEVNGLQHFLSTQNLLAFTNNGTWNVNSGSLREGLSYANIRFDLEDDTGCSYLRPLKSGRSVLMVPTFRKGVRELMSDFQAQGTQGRNLELMSDHLFENDAVVDWDFQRDEERLYCIMASGVCNILTYIPEQQMIAWTQWQTDGSYENVCVLPGDDRYIPYFIVKRTVNAVEKRFIEEGVERLPDTDLVKGVFLDASKSYDGGGTPVTQFTGMDHLAGETITVLADGVVVEGVQVVDLKLLPEDPSIWGFNLDPAADIVHAGIGYQSGFKSLELMYGTQEGTGFADLKAIPELTLTLENTLGIEVGPNEDNLSEFNADVDSSGMLNGKFTNVIESDWDNKGQIHVRQSKPFPVTIMSHISDGLGSDV